MLDGAWAKLQVWDTAGQERFRTITAAYYRGAGGVLLVYDVSDAASFASVRNWLRGIDQHAADGVVKVSECMGGRFLWRVLRGKNNLALSFAGRGLPSRTSLSLSLSLSLNQVLVGNKADIPESDRAVSTAQGAALAKECGMAFFEASAKSGEGVDEAFLAAARSVVAKGGGGTAGREGGLRLGGPGAGGGAGGRSGAGRSACCS